MARNVVLPVSLTRLGSMCMPGSLLNLDVLMCRALLAINIAEMSTYYTSQVGAKYVSDFLNARAD